MELEDDTDFSDGPPKKKQAGQSIAVASSSAAITRTSGRAAAKTKKNYEEEVDDIEEDDGDDDDYIDLVGTGTSKGRNKGAKQDIIDLNDDDDDDDDDDEDRSGINLAPTPSKRARDGASKGVRSLKLTSKSKSNASSVPAADASSITSSPTTRSTVGGRKRGTLPFAKAKATNEKVSGVASFSTKNWD